MNDKVISTQVEKATLTDIDALVDLRLAYLNEDHGQLDESETASIRKRLPEYFRDHLGRDLLAYVVREGQQIAACAFLLVIEKPISPAFLTGKTGTVLNVYTCPEARGRGYAHSIMEMMIEEARRLELSSVDLKATDAGYQLYRSVGFGDEHSKYHPMVWRNEGE